MEGARAGHVAAAFASEPLERGPELAALGESIAAAVAGAGRVLVLEGAAGVGKSRLIEAACEIAGAKNVRVLRARCRELEAALPWSLARALLSPSLEAMTVAAREQALRRAGEQARILLGPEAGPPEGVGDRCAGTYAGTRADLAHAGSRRTRAARVGDR